MVTRSAALAVKWIKGTLAKMMIIRCRCVRRFVGMELPLRVKSVTMETSSDAVLNASLTPGTNVCLIKI